MADVIFRSNTEPLNTGGATQTFTVPGALGGANPKAAIFITTSGVTDGVVNNPLTFSIGWTDGINQAATSITEAHNVSSSASARRHSDAAVALRISSSTGDEAMNFSFNSWTADGVVLNINNAPTTNWLMTYILIGGDDVVSVDADLLNMGTGTSAIPVTTGFEPSVVFAMTSGNLATVPPSGGLTAIVSHGVCVNDGTDSQGSVYHYGQPNQSTTNNASVISNSSIMGQAASSGISWNVACGGFGPTGFTLTPSASTTNAYAFYLALEFQNSPDISLFDMSWPTAGDYTETTPNYQPDFGFIVSDVGPTARDSYTNSSVTSSAITIFDATNINTENIQSQGGKNAGVSQTNTSSLSASTARALKFDASGDAFLASGYSFTSTGWSFPLTTNPVTNPVLGFALAIGPGGAPGVTFDGPDVVAQAGTENTLFSFDENGEGTVASRFTGATSYAYAPGSEQPAGLTVNATTGNLEGTPTTAGSYDVTIEGSD